MAVLISYFKNNVVLLNNLIEISDKIITKIDDLPLLIALLLSISKSDVQVEVEEITMKGFVELYAKRFHDIEKLKILLLIKNNLLKFLTISTMFKWV
jgi:hypothetical protein